MDWDRVLSLACVLVTQGRGGVKHFGFYIGAYGPYAHAVIHNRKGLWVVVESLDDFSPDGTWRVDRRAPPGSEAAVIERAFSRIGHPYRLLDWNCEHLISWVLTGKKQSEQLQQAVVVAAVGAFLGWAFSQRDDSDDWYDGDAGRWRDGRTGRFVRT